MFVGPYRQLKLTAIIHGLFGQPFLSRHIGTVEDGGITFSCAEGFYAAVFDGSGIWLLPCPQFALWATNISSASPTQDLHDWKGYASLFAEQLRFSVGWH